LGSRKKNRITTGRGIKRDMFSLLHKLGKLRRMNERTGGLAEHRTRAVGIYEGQGGVAIWGV